MTTSAGEAVDLLVEADFLYPLSESDEVVLGGEVAITGERIVYVGPARPAGTWRARRRIAGGGKAVLPGFVNSHCHTASSVFRSQSDDGAGGAALYTVAFRAEKDITAGDWRALARLGVIEMIKAGVTTINDIWYEPEALAEACLAAGLRAQIAHKVFDVRLENLWEGDYTRSPALGAERLRRGIEFAEAWQGAGNGLITARLGPHASDTCADGLHREAATEARRLGIGLHTHVAQSRQEVEAIRAAHGKGPGAYLAGLGVLGPDSVLAHLTFADADDLQAIAESGATYAHCSTIYPRRGVYPDLTAIEERGIPTGLATDWMMNDPFEAMRNLLNARRLLCGRHDVVSCADALTLVTCGSARVLSLSHEIGRLEPGCQADLILLDLDRPHMQPFYGDFASIVYYARAADVTTAVIKGQVVMEDRQVLGVDEAAALAAVKQRSTHWGQQLRQLGGVSRLDACGCPSH